MKTQKDRQEFTKSLVSLLALIVISLLAWLGLRSCQKDPVPVAAPAKTTAQLTLPATLSQG